MAFKVLVVDDSTFYRRRLKMILEEDRQLQVVGEASNGQEAIDLIKELSPDVVTMDVEMPVMDGISAVRKIMQVTPVPILMFSSLTHAGAQATLDALEAGALDFLPKKFEDISRNKTEALNELRTKVRIVARRKPFMRRKPAGATFTPAGTRPGAATPPRSTFMRSSSVLTGQKHTSEQVSVSSISRSGKRYKCLAIGASTGGPVALQTVLTKLPSHFSVPILIIQHMPGTFTEAFANRLDAQCKIKVVHAESGMRLEKGTAYVAPGGKQCVVEGHGDNAKILIRDTLANENLNYKPSVDLCFSSVADAFGGDVLAIVLTGMGADGKIGGQKLYDKGAKIWAQDQASCVVYGMPQAVASAGITAHSIGLDHIADCVITEIV